MALIQQVKDGKFVDETTGKSSTSTKSSEKDKKTNELGYDQFLQILCAEMQYQDPLEPTSNTEYIAQLATFSQLESQLSVQSTIEASSANDLVGKYVIMSRSDPTASWRKMRTGNRMHSFSTPQTPYLPYPPHLHHTLDRKSTQIHTSK